MMSTALKTNKQSTALRMFACFQRSSATPNSQPKAQQQKLMKQNGKESKHIERNNVAAKKNDDYFLAKVCKMTIDNVRSK